MTSFYILLRVHTYGQFPLNEANGRVIQWYPIKSGSQIFFRRFGYLMSVHRSDPGWSWMIWKLSEWLHFSVYGMVFWGAESISDIIFYRKALWWPNFQNLSYFCHFLMNFDNFSPSITNIDIIKLCMSPFVCSIEKIFQGNFCWLPHWTIFTLISKYIQRPNSKYWKIL